MISCCGKRVSSLRSRVRGVLDIAIELDLVISGVEVGNGTMVACKDLEVSGILYG